MWHLLCPRTFRFVPIDTAHALLYVKYNVHGGKSVTLRVLFWIDIKYRAAVGPNSVSLLHWHSAYCPPEYCHADSRQQDSWHGRRKVRYSTEHTGHQVYLEKLSKATGRYAEGSVLTDCMVAVSCRNWGNPQNPEEISMEEIRNKDHQTHFRIQSPEATEMSQGDWGKPRKTSCETTGFWEFEAEYSLGILMIFSLLKFWNWYFVAMMLYNRTFVLFMSLSPLEIPLTSNVRVITK
jgi:hypothetical protein